MTTWEKFNSWYGETGWRYVSSREGAFQVWLAAQKEDAALIEQLENALIESNTLISCAQEALAAVEEWRKGK